MPSTRRTTILQILGVATGLLKPCFTSQLYASASQLNAATPPKEITANIHGRKIRLRFAFLRSQQEVALYSQLWFLHLTYGLIVDQEFVAKDDGMELTFQSGTGPEQKYIVKPFITEIELTDDSQAYLALLASCILAAVTQGDGFQGIPKSSFGIDGFRNWMKHPESATSLDKELTEICKSVLQQWNGKSPAFLVSQMQQLPGEPTAFPQTYRKERIQTVCDWMLQSKSVGEGAAKKLVLQSTLQAFLDFGRWQFSWMEHFCRLQGQLENTPIVGQLEVRDRSRWIALAIAYKCLFGSQQLPSVRFAVSSNAMTPLAVILGDVKASFLRFPVTAFAAENTHAIAASSEQRKSEQLTDAFPQLVNLWDYPLYAIVASLGLSSVSRERTKFLKTTHSTIGKHIEELIAPEDIVLGTSRDPARNDIDISVANWHWFRDWKALTF